MINGLISFCWGFLPTAWSLKLWRLSAVKNLPALPTETANFFTWNKDTRWTKTEAWAYRKSKIADPSITADDERLVRLIEIRKSNFFSGTPCSSASIIATTLAELGQKNNDLRLINTALKLRDIVVTSLPPIYSADRAFFHAADNILETTLEKLEIS